MVLISEGDPRAQRMELVGCAIVPGDREIATSHATRKMISKRKVSLWEKELRHRATA